MPDGSPIDQWWKSHRPVQVTTNNARAVHAIAAQDDRRPYCGYRGRPVMTTEVPAVVDCSACIAAINADIAARGTQK